MKPNIQIFSRLPAILLLLALAGSVTLFAAPTNQTAKLEIHQSVFAYPNSPSEGRDPFFPNSARPYGSDSDNTGRGASLADLTLRTIVGIPPHVVALINNHPFAPGDEGDVATRGGQRLHIHCVDINPNAGTATVEANGISDVLHLSEEP